MSLPLRQSDRKSQKASDQVQDSPELYVETMISNPEKVSIFGCRRGLGVTGSHRRIGFAFCTTTLANPLARLPAQQGARGRKRSKHPCRSNMLPSTGTGATRCPAGLARHERHNTGDFSGRLSIVCEDVVLLAVTMLQCYAWTTAINSEASRFE